jgi:hypothetical protein
MKSRSRPLHDLHPPVTVGDRHGPVESLRIEIGTGTELASGSGHDQDSIVAVLKVGESPGQRGPSVSGDGILSLRSIDDDPTYLFRAVDLEPTHPW